MLENKLGIINQLELNRVEERVSKEKAKQLYDSGDIDRVEVGTFKGLSYIHNYLFEDIYEFAGKVRSQNISKGNFRFAPVMYLEVSLEHIDKMPQSNLDEIVAKMERSPVKDLEIKYLILNALTDKINDREIFMKGIDISYYYEGYTEYNVDDL